MSWPDVPLRKPFRWLLARRLAHGFAYPRRKAGLEIPALTFKWYGASWPGAGRLRPGVDGYPGARRLLRWRVRAISPLAFVFMAVLGAAGEKRFGGFGSLPVCGCGCPVVSRLLAVLFIVAARGCR